MKKCLSCLSLHLEKMEAFRRETKHFGREDLGTTTTKC